MPCLQPTGGPLLPRCSAPPLLPPGCSLTLDSSLLTSDAAPPHAAVRFEPVPKPPEAQMLACGRCLVSHLPATCHAALGLLASHSQWYAAQSAARKTVARVFADPSVPSAAGELCFPAQNGRLMVTWIGQIIVQAWQDTRTGGSVQLEDRPCQTLVQVQLSCPVL